MESQNVNPSYLRFSKIVQEEVKRTRVFQSEQLTSVPDLPASQTEPAELGRGHGRRIGNEHGFSISKQDTQGGDLTNVSASFEGSFQPTLNIYSQSSTATGGQKGTTEEINYIRSGLSKIYGMQAAWIIPLPFDKDLLLKPEEHFVELSLEVLDRSGVFERGGLTQLSALVDPISQNLSGMRARHVLIRGEAGFGKSTLCTKIGHDWANGKTTFPPLPFQTTLLILLRLRELPKGSDPEQVLLEMVHSHSSNPEGDVSETRKLLRSCNGDILLLLDGYDEISRDQQEQVKNTLLKTKTTGPQSPFRNAVVIITSRLETDKELLTLFDRHFIIQGLSDYTARELVKLYFKEKEVQKQLEDELMRTFLNITSTGEKLSPIMILLLCYISEHEEISFYYGLEKLIVEVIFLFSKRYSHRESLEIDDAEIRRKLRKLGQFFFQSLKGEKLLFQETELRQCLGSDFTFLTKSCALKRPFSLNKTVNVYFEPTHKLLMESLATYFLNNELSTVSDEKSKLRFWECIFDLEASKDLGIWERNGALEHFICLGERFPLGLSLSKKDGLKFKVKSTVRDIADYSCLNPIWPFIGFFQNEGKLQSALMKDLLRAAFPKIHFSEGFSWGHVKRMCISPDCYEELKLSLILENDSKQIVNVFKESVNIVARSRNCPGYEPVQINIVLENRFRTREHLQLFFSICTAIRTEEIKGCDVECFVKNAVYRGGTFLAPDDQCSSWNSDSAILMFRGRNFTFEEFVNGMEEFGSQLNESFLFEIRATLSKLLPKKCELL